MAEEAERAYQKALFLLERRDHTEAELRQKLKNKDFLQNSIDTAIERLKEYKFIDDRRFTEQYLRYHMGEQSRRSLAMKLLQKGIRSDLFEAVYGELMSELDVSPEQEALKKAVRAALRKSERKGYSINCLPKEEKNRIVASLYRKGFAVGKINAELDKAAESS